MANSSLSQAKIILLAVRVVIKADIPTLRTLVAQQRKALRSDILLRILLTYLPESLDSSKYVPFLQDLNSGQISADDDVEIDTSSIEEISAADANKKVKKLHLLPLTWPSAPPDAPEDPFILFLIHRAYRIDQETGLITQLPELITPFLSNSQYLRTWMISSLLPLLRLNYEHHPRESALTTIASFENLDDRTAVNFLLSRTGKRVENETNSKSTIGQDLRGLVGPWIYGNSRRKRRKVFDSETQNIAPIDEVVVEDHESRWEEVFSWITSQATSSWIISVEAIEQWDGPSDVDLGGYGNGMVWLEEREQEILERRYARAALAAAYLIPEASVEALASVQRILERLVALLDIDKIPPLPIAAALLEPIPAAAERVITTSRNATYLRTALMEEKNILTTPNLTSISFLQGILISAFLLTRAGVHCTIRKAGELVLLQDEAEQKLEVQRLILKIVDGPKTDDKYWIRMRNELLWLRDWGVDELTRGSEGSQGSGVFGKIRKDFLEMEIFKAMLSNSRYALARSIYEMSSEKPLSSQQMRDKIISAAMYVYDNASNANRTRGGVKKCGEIMDTFPTIIRGTLANKRLDHLLDVTHSIGQYRLVLKQGEPFTPVIFRVHADPISIIGKILDQNERAYNKINELIRMGEQIVLAGLTIHDVEGYSTMEPEQEQELLSIAQKRVTSMCIDSALTSDDFETAYSYVMNRLSPVASEAQARTPQLERSDTGIFAQPPPRVLDDWSWRAALQAGKYRPNGRIAKPTHLGNASGNLEIRHLEQRKDCLSLALRIAPPSTLHEILNAFRRCEEELDTKIMEEAEQEAAWDEQGDQAIMPGGFSIDRPNRQSRGAKITSSAVEEAPMSLFDLTRASAAKAQSSLSSLTSLTSGAGRDVKPKSTANSENLGVRRATVRKRDQLRNVAVGTLATGIGWLINAPVPAPVPE